MFILLIDVDNYVIGDSIEKVVNKLEKDWDLHYSPEYKIYEATELKVQRKFEIVKEQK